MEKNTVIIVGGGIVGLATAYYLNKRGLDVTVIDSGSIENNCSFGNMGYLSPSHYIPLASPGIVAEGLSYVLNSKSPFYIKPRFDLKFIEWAWKFYRSSNQRTVDKNSPHLEALLKLSRHLMDEIRDDIGDVFDMEGKGCMMMCHSKAAFDKEVKVAEGGKKLGLNTIILNRKELQEYEPDVELDIYGGVLFTDDGHIHPGKFMHAMKNHLEKSGVHFELNTKVEGFKKSSTHVGSVFTDKGDFSANMIILSPGSWLGELTGKLGHTLLIQGGKGYSTTYDNVEKNLHYPAILVDGRCAMTPWKNRLRIGGTMELSGLNNRILVKRMHGIYDSVKKFYPGLKIDFPSNDKIWTGLRPVTPDGLPYIGALNGYQNLFIAGGSAMLGVSTAAGIGKLISEITGNENTEIQVDAFAPGRFS